MDPRRGGARGGRARRGRAGAALAGDRGDRRSRRDGLGARGRHVDVGARDRSAGSQRSDGAAARGRAARAVRPRAARHAPGAARSPDEQDPAGGGDRRPLALARARPAAVAGRTAAAVPRRHASQQRPLDCGRPDDRRLVRRLARGPGGRHRPLVVAPRRWQAHTGASARRRSRHPRGPSPGVPVAPARAVGAQRRRDRPVAGDQRRGTARRGPAARTAARGLEALRAGRNGPTGPLTPRRAERRCAGPRRCPARRRSRGRRSPGTASRRAPRPPPR